MPRTPPSEVLYPVVLPDGATFRVGVWEADDPLRPVLIVVPAMGAPVEYYRPFLTRLHRAGLSLVATDWRGHGRNEPLISRQTRFGYTQMVTDLVAMGHWTRDRFPSAPIFFLGHSLGGQLSLLTLAWYPQLATGAILITAGSVYYRTYPRRLWTLAETQFAAGLATLWGVWPGKRWGFADTEAAGVMRDWARQARTGIYRPSQAPLDFESALGNVFHPILAISVDKDSLAPVEAIDHLCAKVPAATITRWHNTGDALNHFNWIRHCRPFIEQIIGWLDHQMADTHPQP